MPFAKTNMVKTVVLGNHSAGKLLQNQLGLSRTSILLASGIVSVSAYKEIGMDSPASPPKSMHSFTCTDIDGNLVPLNKYKGQVALVVNVASAWGLTDTNYKQLVELHRKYRPDLAVLAFPCNQFGNQESGTNAKIKEFASKYDVEFDMFAKIKVNGDQAEPLWDFLKKKQGGMLGNFIKWNFTKFLVDAEGKPVARYSPKTNPIPDIEKDIKKYIELKNAQ